MSRLRELMKELCPDGVEYKKLGEFLSRHTGMAITAGKMKELHIPNGEIRIFAAGNTFADVRESDIDESAVIREPGIIVKSRGNIGFEYYTKPFSHKNEMWSYTCCDNATSLKYVYYMLEKNVTYFQNKAKTGKLPQISIVDTENYEIPVPPLEIQNEIVKLLDNFTELTAELTEQLMTELTLRKKQYNFYRDSLLNFVRVDDTIVQTDRQTDRQAQRISKFRLWRKTFEVEWKALGEVAYYVRDRIETQNVRVDNYVGVENLLQDRAGRCVADSLPNVHTSIAFTHNDILIGNIRPYLKKIWMANCSGGTNGDVLTIRLNEGEKILHRYLYYALSSNQFFHYDVTYSKGTKMPRGDKCAVMKYPIPVPPLEVQQKIISILDRFDALCNDLTSGLPAEIAARKKQYEHYRDKLLTFPRSKLEERS